MNTVKLGSRELQGIQKLIDSLPFYAMLVDEDHTIIAINDLTEQTLGIRREEVICQHCPQVIHGQDQPFEGCPLEQAVTLEQHVEVEVYDREHKQWLLSMASPTDLETEDGKRIYLHFTKDITETKDATEDLARSLEHHRVLARLLQRLQVCSNATQVLEEVMDRVLSLSWSGLTGSAVGFLCEGNLLRMVAQRNVEPAVQRECASVPLGHCLCGQAALERERLVVSCADDAHPEHHHLPGHGHVVLPLTHMGQTLAVLSFYLPAGGEALEQDKVSALEVLADLAAVALGRLQMQVQLAHTDRMASLGLSASILAHDIRTPLNALSIQIQRTLRRLKDHGPLEPEALPGLLGGLQAEVLRINQQIEDHLLAIVRHDQPSRRIDANVLMTESAAFMEPEAEFKHIQIRCTLADDLEPVLVEPTKLRRILLNLLLNAIQAMPQGGEVQLATRMEEGSVVLSVTDRGAGFSEPLDGELNQVLQPFITTKKDGTGLGLAICARLIGELHGTIHCRSMPGEGACFEVHLQPASCC